MYIGVVTTGVAVTIGTACTTGTVLLGDACIKECASNAASKNIFFCVICIPLAFVKVIRIYTLKGFISSYYSRFLSLLSSTALSESVIRPLLASVIKSFKERKLFL